MTINDLLSTYRLTQTELSRRLGIPLRTVQHWCNGTRQPPLYVLKLLEESLSRNSK